VGQETSSRNSEVIHAGLYYGADSLKTKLCIQGREKLYALCAAHNIPHRNCKKWIVAQDADQMKELESLKAHCDKIGVPMRFISLEEAKEREPAVRAKEGVLESESTGVVDSHALMEFLEGEFADQGGLSSFKTSVTGLSALEGGGYEIKTEGEGEHGSITAGTLINAAGLGAVALSNMLLPPDRHRKAYYAKGNYFSYSSSSPKTKTLIYPAPQPGLGGLGTHLTLDMAGRVRFGPDVEWIEDPSDLSVNESRIPDALKAIKEYLPGLDGDALAPDYSGIRPKLVGEGQGKADFYIVEEEGYKGFVNLLGIESPGLTSCLAIADVVEGLVYK
jgi:2-hydroxyglutarate dehydrogenase